MNKKLLTIFTFIATVGIICINFVTAKGLFANPEIQGLSQKNMKDVRVQDKNKSLDALKEEEARIIEKQNINMSKDKKDAVIMEKEQKHKEQLKKIASYITPSVQPEKSSFKGIVEGNNAPSPFQSNEFTALNFWGGEIDGKAIGIYAGYYPENPLQGVIAVFDDRNNSKSKFYSTPKSTGPIRIISELNGTLTLKSVSGEFEIYDQNVYPSKKVQTSDSSAYLFDIRKQLFQ